MSLKNIKSKTQAERGFTIVELLIVVVVIAILAAITIVSYNGITNRANSSAAASTAAAFQKKSELFISDGPTGAYPRALADLTGAAAILTATPAQTTNSTNTWYVAPGSILISSSAPNASNGKNTIRYEVCGHDGTAVAVGAITNMTTVTGGIITYYNFADSTTETINLGTTTTGGNPNVACVAAAS